MAHLFYVRFGGDEQGTVLERKLKETARQDYNNSVCTENAVEGIFNKLRQDCKTLADANPRCKAAGVRLFKDGMNYRIALDRANDGCNCGNNTLLYFRILSAFYLHADESLWAIADDNALSDWSDNVIVYNI